MDDAERGDLDPAPFDEPARGAPLTVGAWLTLPLVTVVGFIAFGWWVLALGASPLALTIQWMACLLPLASAGPALIRGYRAYRDLDELAVRRWKASLGVLFLAAGLALVIVPVAPLATLGALSCGGGGYGLGDPAQSGRRIAPGRYTADGWSGRAVVLGVGAALALIGAPVLAHVVVFPGAVPLAIVAGALAVATGFATRRARAVRET